MTTGSTPEETDQSRDRVSKTVIRRRAIAAECDAATLSPLYETIDPDAVDHLVASAQRRDTELSIQFTYDGREISIDGDAVHCERR